MRRAEGERRKAAVPDCCLSQATQAGSLRNNTCYTKYMGTHHMLPSPVGILREVLLYTCTTGDYDALYVIVSPTPHPFKAN